MSSTLKQIVDDFVVELAKTYRAAQFYPSDHPNLTRSIERSFGRLRAVFFSGSSIEVVISKTQILFDGAAVLGPKAMLSELTTALFRRRVKHMGMSSDVTDVELQNLIEFLTDDPREIQRIGGPEKALGRRGVMNIWCNERQFSRTEVNELADEEAMEGIAGGGVAGGILDDEVEAEGPAPAAFDPMSLLMALKPQGRERKLGEALVQEQDPQTFAKTLQNVLRVGKDEIGAKNYQGPATLAMILYARMRELNPAISPLAQKGLIALVSPNLLKYLLHEMQTAVGSQWEVFRDLIAGLGKPVIPYLLVALSETESRKERLRMLETVQMFGTDAEAYLVQQLRDERWYVVRNSLYVLGGWAHDNHVANVVKLLFHDHESVRKEAAAFLRKVGTEDAFNALAKALKKANDKDARVLLHEIAAFPTAWAEPLVLPYLKKGHVSSRIEAASALSVIASPKALEALAKAFLAKSSLFEGKEKHLAFRRAVGERLLAMLPDAMPVFDRVREDESASIRKLVSQADAIMRRNEWVYKRPAS